MEDVEVVAKVFQFLTQRGITASAVKDEGDFVLVKVPRPEELSTEELEKVAGKPVKLEELPYGVG